MLIEDMDNDSTYEMLVDGEVKMLSLGSFFKEMISHPKVIESCDNISTNISDVEYREVGF